MGTDIDKKIDGLAGRISKLETGMDSIRKELHQATYFMAGLIVSIWAVTLLTCVAVFTLSGAATPHP